MNNNKEFNKIKNILDYLVNTQNYVSRDEKFGFGKNECLYPNCKIKPLINSHLYSKKFLKNIQDEKGEVTVFNHKLDVNDLKTLKIINSTDVNIKSASVFLGFCEYHDNNIFKVFENHKDIDTIFENKKQCDYYSYRTIMFQKFNMNAKKQVFKIPFKKYDINIDINDEQYKNSILNNKLSQNFIYEKPEINIDNLEHYVIKINEGFNLLNHVFMNFKVLSFIGAFIIKNNPDLMIGKLLNSCIFKKEIYIISNTIQTKKNETTVILSWDKNNKHINLIKMIIYLLSKYIKRTECREIISYIYCFNLMYSDWLIIKKVKENYLNNYELEIFKNILKNYIYNKNFILDYNRLFRYKIFFPINSNIILNKKIEKDFKFYTENKKELIKYLKEYKGNSDFDNNNKTLLIQLFDNKK